MKDDLNYTVFNALGALCAGGNESPDAGLGDAPKGAPLGLGRGVNAFFSIVSPLQGVKICKGWLKLRNFNALGAAHCMHFSVLFLDCSMWENTLHGCKSGCNTV